MTLGREEALSRLRAARAPESSSWPCRIGPLRLRFPNFSWRRRALAAHDLHHLMTGYPMTMRGEFQMAAWELGAGPYRNLGAILFCAPLLVAGLFWSPAKMARAFRLGRQTTSLYCELDRLERRRCSTS